MARCLEPFDIKSDRSTDIRNFQKQLNRWNDGLVKTTKDTYIEMSRPKRLRVHSTLMGISNNKQVRFFVIREWRKKSNFVCSLVESEPTCTHRLYAIRRPGMPLVTPLAVHPAIGKPPKQRKLSVHQDTDTNKYSVAYHGNTYTLYKYSSDMIAITFETDTMRQCQPKYKSESEFESKFESKSKSKSKSKSDN